MIAHGDVERQRRNGVVSCANAGDQMYSKPSRPYSGSYQLTPSLGCPPPYRMTQYSAQAQDGEDQQGEAPAA